MKISLDINKKKSEIDIDAEATIDDLRNRLATDLNTSAAQICLVLKGKLLTSKGKLKALGMKENDTIIVILKKVNVSL